MCERSRTWPAKLTVVAVSMLLTLAVLEFVVFRTILVPDDLIENVSINGVVRYQPNTRAVFRHPDGSRSLVTINADGWNSTKPEYVREKTPGRTRIAVVGDSYVNDTTIDVGAGFAEVMERGLATNGVDAEVFRFGMDGAPLSHYLHMLRREVLAFRPDVVVVPVLHNDFDESYREMKSRYAASFLKLARAPDGNVREIPPKEFRSGLADKLRYSSMFRYLYYKTSFYLYAKGWVSRVFWGGNEQWAPQFIQSAVDIRNMRDHASNRLFARYVLAQMQALSREHGFKLLIVMDGVREAVYEGRRPGSYEVGRLNQIAAEVTTELGISFLDLQETFAQDYKRHGKRFEFSFDWHWNRDANRLIGETLAARLVVDLRQHGEQVRRAAQLAAPRG